MRRRGRVGRREEAEERRDQQRIELAQRSVVLAVDRWHGRERLRGARRELRRLELVGHDRPLTRLRRVRHREVERAQDDRDEREAVRGESADSQALYCGGFSRTSSRPRGVPLAMATRGAEATLREVRPRADARRGRGWYAVLARAGLVTKGISFGIVGHSGDWREAGTDWQGYRLNDPLRAFTATRHPGSLGRSFSLVHLNNPRVRVLALKKAEATDEIVVRLVELDGKPAKDVRLSFASPVRAVRWRRFSCPSASAPASRCPRSMCGSRACWSMPAGATGR